MCTTESGILLKGFAACPSVNHSWIFHVLDKTELPEFLCRFLRRIYYDSTTRVEFAGMTRRQFLTARGVRQGCPASGFLFAMEFETVFCWLQDTIIPRNSEGLDLLQPAPCAYAHDLAVAASSFRDLMTALAPACQLVDQRAGLILNHRKGCWVQYGSETHESFLNFCSNKIFTKCRLSDLSSTWAP